MVKIRDFQVLRPNNVPLTEKRTERGTQAVDVSVRGEEEWEKSDAIAQISWGKLGDCKSCIFVRDVVEYKSWDKYAKSVVQSMGDLRR